MKTDGLVKFEIIKLPEILVIGKELRYGDDALNNGDNRLPAFWDNCLAEKIFAPLEARAEFIFNVSRAGVFLDWDLGDGDFSYIVGLLMKPGATVPDGYFSRTLPETEAAYCRYGRESVIETRTAPFGPFAEAIKKAGRSCADLYDETMSVTPDGGGFVYMDCYIPLD